ADTAVRPPLFATVEQPAPAARDAVTAIGRSCTFSEFSRVGPSPAVRRRCDEVMKKAIALGPPAAQAALVAMNGEVTGFTPRARLFDLVSRVGDVSLAPVLVGGLSSPEADAQVRVFIEEALRKLTYAHIGEPTPWNAEELGAHRTAAVASVEWRAF